MSVTNLTKWWISLQSAFIFFCIANPVTFEVTDDISRIMGLPPVLSGKVPTPFGMLLHSIVYLLIVRLMMY